MPDIVKHLERFLGPIENGWKDNDQQFSEIQIISFKNTPFESTYSFATLGVSNHVLNLSTSKRVRQELLFASYDLDFENNIVSLLFSVSESIVQSHKALFRGQVVKIPPEAVQIFGFDGLYCSIPVFYDEDFYTYNESEPPTVFVMLIPIYNAEINYINVNGWEKFEDLMEEKDPDLFSFNRTSLIA